MFELSPDNNLLPAVDQEIVGTLHNEYTVLQSVCVVESKFKHMAILNTQTVNLSFLLWSVTLL